MTVTLELPPEIEAQVVEQAALRGLPLETYLQTLIVERAAPNPVPVLEEDWESELDELAAAGSALPVLPDAAFDRASIYQDHD